MADKYLTAVDVKEDEFGDLFGADMMNFFMIIMFASMMMILNKQQNLGIVDGYRGTAVMDMKSLTFNTPVQAATITNDGILSYIYFYVNSLDAEPVELRPGDVANLKFDSATFARLYYCTRGGSSDFRVDVLY